MAKAKPNEPSKQRLLQSEMPGHTLEESLAIARALVETYAGRSAAPYDVAAAVNLSPTSSTWKMISGAACAYGLTQGAYGAEQIVLLPLGRACVEGDRAAILNAILAPRACEAFWKRYARQKFPKPEMAERVLPVLGLPKDRVDKYYEILKANGILAGILREQGSGYYVAFDGSGSAPSAAANDPDGTMPPSGAGAEVIDFETRSVIPEQETQPAAAAPPPPAQPAKPKMIFVAHGKNHRPLEELKKILTKFGVPFKVAIDEPHTGRPISAKVAAIMNECSAGIFIFTKDEQFFKKLDDGTMEEIWRPSENVVYELGAASPNWEKKIIIMREKGVKFPSDFSELGYIEFGDGGLANQAMDIFTELIALGLVKIEAA
jgi:predicted nucleotide-binding protein